MERTEQRAVKREIYSQIIRRFGVKKFERRGSVVVTEEWLADGSISRTTKMQEIQPGEDELLLKMLSLAPPQEDQKQPVDQVKQTPQVDPTVSESPKGDKAEMPEKAAEQSPASQQDDQADIKDRVEKNSAVGTLTLKFSELPEKTFDYMNEMNIPTVNGVDTDDWPFTFSYASDGA